MARQFVDNLNLTQNFNQAVLRPARFFFWSPRESRSRSTSEDHSEGGESPKSSQSQAVPDQRVDQLMALAARQQKQIDAMRKNMGDLREEYEAMQVCLSDAGLLRKDGVAATLHKRRFSSTLAMYPTEWEVGLRDVLQFENVSLMLAKVAGPETCGILQMVAPNTRGDMVASVAALDKIEPSVLYVIGGFDGEQCLSSCEFMYPEFPDQRWEHIPDMNFRREFAASAVLQGCLIAIGGLDQSGFPLSTVEAFDPLKGIWELMPSMTLPRWGLSVAVVHDTLYAIGGSDGRQILRTVERFDKTKGAWELISEPMMEPRVDASAVPIGGKLYVIGGSDGGRGILSSVESYDPNTGAWEALPPLQTCRRRAGCAAIGKTLYAAGGTDGQSALHSVERFNVDRAGSTWQMAPPMLTGRAEATATTVGGYMYVLGGSDGTRSLESAERFRSRTGQWERVSHMLACRFAAACAVGTGPVLGHPPQMQIDEGYYSALDECNGMESNRWGSSAPRAPPGRLLVTSRSFPEIE